MFSLKNLKDNENLAYFEIQIHKGLVLFYIQKIKLLTSTSLNLEISYKYVLRFTMSLYSYSKNFSVNSHLLQSIPNTFPNLDRLGNFWLENFPTISHGKYFSQVQNRKSVCKTIFSNNFFNYKDKYKNKDFRSVFLLSFCI